MFFIENISLPVLIYIFVLNFICGAYVNRNSLNGSDIRPFALICGIMMIVALSSLYAQVMTFELITSLITSIFVFKVGVALIGFGCYLFGKCIAQTDVFAQSVDDCINADELLGKGKQDPEGYQSPSHVVIDVVPSVVIK